MGMSLSEAHREIRENLDNSRDVQEFRLYLGGSVHLGLTETFLRLVASQRGVKLITQLGSLDDVSGDLSRMPNLQTPHGVVLTPFFDLIVQEFETRLTEFSSDELESIEKQFIEKWALAIGCVPNNAQIVVLGLHPIATSYPYWKSVKSQIVERFNGKLNELVQKNPGAIFLDIGALIFEQGRRNAIDHRMYLKARMPYTPKFSESLAPLVLDALKVGRSPFKVLAIDCDNTIWGGIVGEDGPNGIMLDPNTARGSMYREVQRRLVELQELGVLICLVSKNDERDVLNILNHHEYQILRIENLASWRINWNTKSDNLKSLALELNLGLDSFVFVDDSDFECAEVSQVLPDVAVMRAPSEPETWAQLLEQIKRGLLLGSHENRNNKTSEYRVRKKIEAAKAESPSENAFLQTLNVQLRYNFDQFTDLPRLAEMFLKTNQFNTTLVRRSEREISALMHLPESIVCSFRVNDRFTDHGLVSAVIVHLSQFDFVVTDWLMSCRVLGRQIENGVAAVLGETALSKGYPMVQVQLNQSERNRRAADFLQHLAERYRIKAGVDSYTFDARELMSQKPPWITMRT